MSKIKEKIKNGGLDQYGAERFEQQQFGILEQLALNGLTTTKRMYRYAVFRPYHSCSVCIKCVVCLPKICAL